MRPKKKILLVGDDADRVGILRYLLVTNHYAVVSAYSAAEARVILHEMTVELLFVVWPLDGALKLLEMARTDNAHIPTVVGSYDLESLPVGWAPDLTIGRGQYCSAEILERVKVLTARKRGPKRGTTHGAKAEELAASSVKDPGGA